MKRWFILFMVVFTTSLKPEAQPVKIMLVTGGHAFDTIPFFQLFDSFENVNYEYFQQPFANQEIANGKARNYDVLVFYDMWNDISDAEKNAYIELTKEGKPFLFLHHSLVSYQKWDEFEKLIGGRYIEKNTEIPVDQQSTYQHDLWVEMKASENHPVTKSFGVIKLFDEVYGNTRISRNVKPLLTTSHPKSSPVIGWENQFNASKILYIQPGHDHHAFESEDYRKLLLQAINYLAETNR